MQLYFCLQAYSKYSNQIGKHNIFIALTHKQLLFLIKQKANQIIKMSQCY